MKTAGMIDKKNKVAAERLGNMYPVKSIYHYLRRQRYFDLTWYEKGYEDALERKYKEENEEQEKEKARQAKEEKKKELLEARDEFAMLKNYMECILSERNDLSEIHKSMIIGVVKDKICNMTKEIENLQED